jgi:hypothetical protein
MRSPTTLNRLRLPRELVEQIEARATERGEPLVELAARLLVDQLPIMVAEMTERWLLATYFLAFPIEGRYVPKVVGVRPDDETVFTSGPGP